MRPGERGSIAIAAAIMTLMLITIAAFVYDLGLALVHRRHAQGVADLAAVAVLSPEVDTNQARLQEGAAIDLDAVAGVAAGCAVVVSHPLVAACTPAMVTYDSAARTSHVEFTVQFTPAFIGIIANTAFDITVEADAAVDTDGVTHLVVR